MNFLELHRNWKLFHPHNKKWIPATVPGCVHTDLKKAGLIPDPFWGRNELDLQWIENEDWIYQTDFQISDREIAFENIDLVCDGLDTLASIFLNGKKVAVSENMFVSHRLDVKKLLKRGRNQLEIKFSSTIPYIKRHKKPYHVHEWLDRVGGSSTIRKEPCCYGWDWGPRLVSAGIYKRIGIHFWDTNRIQEIQVRQDIRKNAAEISVIARAKFATRNQSWNLKVFEGEKLIAESNKLRVEIQNPKLWWPNGLGEQPLYTVEVELIEGSGNGKIIDSVKKRIGLRTIKLDRHKDRFGETFQFTVNGIPIFAKGANWIPDHAFVTEITRDDYRDRVKSARDANMNMLRVWGGGIYESDDFYDLCDEMGILVWQDFMFACALYPGDNHFLKLVKEEAIQQVTRLRHHACLALWCGNNELEMRAKEIVSHPKRRKAYEDVFYKILPSAVKDHDGVTPYWPSSPHDPRGYKVSCENPRAGDVHYWQVWHALKPVKIYETTNFRFVSEFGMQSYPSKDLALTFCPPGELNIFSPIMDNHQKNGDGNSTIFNYVSRLYRFPKDFDSLSYLSQLNQAYCMKVAIEHFRRCMPQTMGALFWQLNDCWPAASWSSLEFGGAWKALHFEAKRFFSPVMVSIRIPGDETCVLKSNNLWKSTIHDVHLHTVSDLTKTVKTSLQWRLYHVSGKVIRSGKKELVVKPGSAIEQLKLDFADEMKKWDPANLILRAFIKEKSRILSDQTAFLTAPKNVNLSRAMAIANLKKTATGEFLLTLGSSEILHKTRFHFTGLAYRASDNYIDLYPGEKREIKVQFKKDISLELAKKRLQVISLVDTY